MCNSGPNGRTSGWLAQAHDGMLPMTLSLRMSLFALQRFYLWYAIDRLFTDHSVSELSFNRSVVSLACSALRKENSSDVLTSNYI